MFKRIAIFLVMFAACLTGVAQSYHVPTLSSNNNWIGENNFAAGHLSLGTVAQQCSGIQVQAGFQADFTPICVTPPGASGVLSIQGLTGNVGLTNTDGNLNFTIVGQNIQVNCPGCGGTGGSPAGGQGAIQWNNSGSFAGTVVVGLVKSSAAGPVAAIPDTDFALPFVLTCSTGISCPKVGENYTFSLTGSAGTGAVGQGNFGQSGSYAATGGSTTIAGSPNIYFLNPSWSASQMQALFNRFNGVPVTAWSITSNVVTFSGNNSFSIGDQFIISGLVTGSFLNGNFYVVTAATQSTFSASFTHANASATENGFAPTNNPGFFSSNGLVVIPPGMTDGPSNAYTNLNAQVLDWRKGYAWQQISKYGIKCDLQQINNVTVTAGSSTINVGASIDTTANGKTLVMSQQNGFSSGALQWEWEPAITYSYPNISLPANAPQNFFGTLYIGTNNQAALTAALNDLGGIFPLNIPVGCNILTDTVRWPGTNLIGQQMNYGGLAAFPYHDILQQQDSIGITAYSISSNVATFTYNPLNEGEVLPLDVYNLASFPVSSFLNGAQITVTSVTPTTFTANFTHANVSNTGEYGIASPTTSASTNGLRLENLGFFMQTGGDPRLPHTRYDPVTAAATTVPAIARPTQEWGQPMNYPFAPGWGAGQKNGVAKIAQNSSVICIPTTVTNVYINGTLTPVTPPLPTIGDVIVFPYQGAGMYTGVVSSTAGSCTPSNYTPYTLSGYNGGSALLPNNAAFTSSQAEWFEFSTPQKEGVALPSTITYPYTLYLDTPFPPIPGYEANVSSHGHIAINGDQFDYMGDQFGGTAATSWSVSAVATSSGGSTTYTGSFTGGFSCSTPVYVLVSGFSTAANNGVFQCTSNTLTTAVLANASAVAQTQSATIQYPAPQIVLRRGPTTINGGAGDAAGSVVFPLHPCYAMFNNPWPVVPSINDVLITGWSVTSNVATFTAANNFIPGMIIGQLLFGNNTLGFNGITGAVVSASPTQFTMNITHANGSGGDQGTVQMATPYQATYYAGRCVGAAALSLPGWNGLNTTFSGSGWSLAHFIDLSFNTAGQNNAGSTAIWEQANNTGYGNTFDDLRGTGLDFGFVQGPATVNQHGVRAVGPTSTGQSMKNCTWRTGYPIGLYNMEQSNIDRCDTYTTETSEYDNSVVGASTSLYLSYSLSEFDGQGITNVSQLTIKDFNSEPENGNHEEVPVAVESDASVTNWVGDIFEGGFNIFGGSFQHIENAQMSNPTFNYGSNNYFNELYGLNNTYTLNIYDGTEQFYNWGVFSKCNAVSGTYGVLQGCGAPGFIQSWNGHDAWSAMFSNGVNPSENVLGGMIVPGEWSGLSGPNFDPTELWWGSWAGCSLGGASECVVSFSPSFGTYIVLGNHKRIAPSQYVIKANVKSGAGSPMSFRILISAQNATSSCVSPNFNLTNQTFTAQTTWTQIQMPVDFTGYAGCNVEVQFDNGSTGVLEIGFFNFVPFTQQLYVPLGTPTGGASCPVAGEFKIDSTHVWVCAPSSGATFGPGTWKSSPIT